MEAPGYKVLHQPRRPSAAGSLTPLTPLTPLSAASPRERSAQVIRRRRSSSVARSRTSPAAQSIADAAAAPAGEGIGTGNGPLANGSSGRPPSPLTLLGGGLRLLTPPAPPLESKPAAAQSPPLTAGPTNAAPRIRSIRSRTYAQLETGLLLRRRALLAAVRAARAELGRLCQSQMPSLLVTMRRHDEYSLDVPPDCECSPEEYALLSRVLWQVGLGLGLGLGLALDRHLAARVGLPRTHHLREGARCDRAERLVPEERQRVGQPSSLSGSSAGTRRHRSHCRHWPAEHGLELILPPGRYGARGRRRTRSS